MKHWQGCIVHLGHWAIARPIIEGITRARTRIGHVAKFARAILDNGGKLTRAHTWLLTMSQFHMRDLG